MPRIIKTVRKMEEKPVTLKKLNILLDFHSLLELLELVSVAETGPPR